MTTDDGINELDIIGLDRKVSGYSISLTTVPTLTGPKSVPAIAAALYEDTRAGGPIEEQEVGIILRMDKRLQRNKDPFALTSLMQNAVTGAKEFVAWFHKSLTESRLWWCSEEMTDLVCEASLTVPDDHVLTMEDLAPHPYGMVIFGRPILGLDALTGERTLQIDGFLWGISHLPEEDDFYGDRPKRVAALTIVTLQRLSHGVSTSYPERLREAFTDYANRNAAKLRDDLLPPMTKEQFDGIADTIFKRVIPIGKDVWYGTGRSDWLFGHRIDKVYGGMDSDQFQSMREDRSLITALFTIASTKTVAETTEVHPDRATKRRVQRVGTDDKVTVVHLRREVPKAADADMVDDTPDGKRHLTVRYIVSAHLRHQAFGPGRSQRKLILIPPHVRGPEGAPLVRRSRVYSLDR